MNATTRLERVQDFYDSAMGAEERMHEDMVAKHTEGAALTDGDINRLATTQAVLWVARSMMDVLVKYREIGASHEATVEAIRRHLHHMMATADLGASSSDAHNLLERAKARTIQTVIATGPLAW